MTSKLALLFFTSLVLLTTGCRSGNTAVCDNREVRACARPDERDAVELVFSREDYGSCTDAVDDSSCGIEAEELRRCVDDLPTPLCVGAGFWQVSSEQLFSTTPCAEALDDYLDCHDDDHNRSSSYSSYDDDDD